MAEDDDISRRYRELPREEPPCHLDEAIRAAARRAVGTRPAPLVVPSGRQRWYFPVAAAAIIVLAVAVTMHVERQQPVEEIVSARPPAAAPEVGMREERAARAPQSAPQPERRRKAEADSTELRDKPAATEAPRELQKAPEPALEPPPSTPAQDALAANQSVAGAMKYRMEAPKPAESAAVAPKPQAATPPPPVAAARPAPEGKPAPRVQALIRPQEQSRADEGARTGPRLAASAMQSPEQWLQGIADLRWQGWHDEADRQLAEFRKRYPDYKIPEPMLEKLKRK